MSLSVTPCQRFVSANYAERWAMRRRPRSSSRPSMGVAIGLLPKSRPRLQTRRQCRNCPVPDLHQSLLDGRLSSHRCEAGSRKRVRGSGASCLSQASLQSSSRSQLRPWCTGIRRRLRGCSARSIYGAQFCALCARICALVGKQSTVLGNRRSHFTHVRKTLLPQRFRHLVALPSDTCLFWRLSKVAQLTCKGSQVQVLLRPPIIPQDQLVLRSRIPPIAEMPWKNLR
jgi:hypothetical protein